MTTAIITPLTVGDTYTNLGFLLEWPGDVDTSETEVTLYAGAFSNYDPGNPFAGVMVVYDRTNSPSLSTITGAYDVKEKDTLVKGRYSLNAHIVHTTGEVETVSAIAFIQVNDELPS